MDLKKLLEDVKNNNLKIEDALEKLKDLPYEDIGYAHIDHHRSIRNGYPEVIYCKGKWWAYTGDYRKDEWKR